MCLAKVALEVFHVIFDFLSGVGDLHGDNLASNDGLFTATAEETKVVVIIVLAEGISVFGREELAGQLLLANRAYKVVRMIRFVQGIDGGAFDRFLAVATGRAEGLFPVFDAISVSVHAFANLTIFELALAHFAEQVVQMPCHVKGLQHRAIDGLLASSTSTTVLHDAEGETALRSALPSVPVVSLSPLHPSFSHFPL